MSFVRTQSNNIMLNAADPDFTQCFEFAAVRLLPCVHWLVLVAPDYALYLAGSGGGVGWRRTSALNIAKLVRLHSCHSIAMCDCCAGEQQRCTVY